MPKKIDKKKRLLRFLMKRLLIPLLAALALPNAVNAETWYLLVKGSKGSMVSVPTS